MHRLRGRRELRLAPEVIRPPNPPAETCISASPSTCRAPSVFKDDTCCPPPLTFLHHPPAGVLCGPTIANNTCVGYLPVGLSEDSVGQYCCSEAFNITGPPNPEA